MKRLRGRPVCEGVAVKAVLTEVKDEVGEPVASQPQQVLLEISGAGAPSRPTERFRHAAPVAELSCKRGGLAG